MDDNETQHEKGASKKNLFSILGRNKYKSILFAILILFILFNYSAKINWSSTYRQEWDICLDLIKEGTLYGGQPHCATGPVLFFTGFIFKFIFGNYFQIALKIFLIALTIVLLYLMYKIIKKETETNDILFILFLSVLWLYPEIGGSNMEKVLAMLFLFFGFYLLYYSKIKLNWLYTGLLLSLAFFSSIQVIILIAIMLGYYPFKSKAISINLKDKKSISFRPKKFVILLKIIGVMLLVFFLLRYIYPNILSYIIFAHSIDPLYGFFESAKHMLPSAFIDSNLFIIYVILGVSAYLFIKNKNVIFIIGSISLFAIFFAIHKGSGGFLISKYTLPSVPFIILTLSLLKRKIRKGYYSEILFYIVLIFLVIFPGFYAGSLSNFIYNKSALTLRDFQQEVSYAINFIPKQEGMVLSDDISLLSKYGYEFEPGEVVVAGNVIEQHTIDAWSGPRLERLGITNLRDWDPAQSTQEETKQVQEQQINAIKKDIEAGEYSLMLYGPRGQGTIVAQAISRLNESVRSQYCSIVLPNLEHLPLTGIHVVTAYMRDASHCQETVLGMTDYYSKVFDHVCEKSSFAANNVVKYTLSLYGIDIGKNCDNGGNFINDFNHHPLFPQHIILILTSVILILIISIPRVKKGSWTENKYAKKIHYLVIIILTIILVYILIKSTKDLGYFLNFIGK